MRKQVYISADYSETDGDKDVVDGKWGHPGGQVPLTKCEQGVRTLSWT